MLGFLGFSFEVSVFADFVGKAVYFDACSTKNCHKTEKQAQITYELVSVGTASASMIGFIFAKDIPALPKGMSRFLSFSLSDDASASSCQSIVHSPVQSR
jgi:hypothetical protein